MKICQNLLQVTGDKCVYISNENDYDITVDSDSDEESDTNTRYGSLLQQRYTMQYPILSAKCVDHFARTGELYPGGAAKERNYCSCFTNDLSTDKEAMQPSPSAVSMTQGYLAGISRKINSPSPLWNSKRTPSE